MVGSDDGGFGGGGEEKEGEEGKRAKGKWWRRSRREAGSRTTRALLLPAGQQSPQMTHPPAQHNGGNWNLGGFHPDVQDLGRMYVLGFLSTKQSAVGDQS